MFASGLSMLWSPTTQAAIPALTDHPTPYLLGGVVIIQMLIIVLVARSRSRHRRKRYNLRTVHRNLEQRESERTQKLRATNNQLYEEIARHERTESLLRETQNYLSSMLNSMPSILIGVSRSGHITHWNTAAIRATNISTLSALGQNLFKVYPDIPITENMITDAIDSGIPQSKENIQHGNGSHNQHSDLTIYPLTGEITGAVIRIDDVTMRVRIENMMIQNEKMMSLGELAAGLAHEINNPLSAILYGLQNIHRRTSSDLPQNHTTAAQLGLKMEDIQAYLKAREILQFLDNIREAGERAAKIVTNMLEFSRSNSRSHKLVNLPDLLEHSLELARNSFELATPAGLEQLEIVREYSPQTPPLRCSGAEIQQVILNLLRNACQAFAHDEYGPPLHPKITLRVYPVENSVRIEIEDNGPGMSEGIRRHIFEPFFTTKEVGRGTGLGLSVTYFIVTEHHDGTIEVESEPGQGTRFIITLPVVDTN